MAIFLAAVADFFAGVDLVAMRFTGTLTGAFAGVLAAADAGLRLPLVAEVLAAAAGLPLTEPRPADFPTAVLPAADLPAAERSRTRCIAGQHQPVVVGASVAV